MSQAALEILGALWPPTEDKLPYDYDMLRETQCNAAQRQAAEAPREAAALETLLACYRERFGDLPEVER